MKAKYSSATVPRKFISPANIFVAGFIGSPPMNFIPAEVHSNETFKINCNGIMTSPELKSIQTKKLIIGIRPEDVFIHSNNTKDEFEVTVSVVEPAGSFNWVDFVWKGVNMKGMSEPGSGVKAGGRAFMTFPHDKIIVFDAVTE
ncbi:MAG: ABC transporter ATP-binding protein [Nitrospiraceae bacterium]|nr:MAG: ABC transporter ATP-binding protein [Nitrospiraceae bacterium]